VGGELCLDGEIREDEDPLQGCQRDIYHFEFNRNLYIQ